MSEFNLLWRRYNLKSNPYFVDPLSIDGQEITVSSFIGRHKERQQLKKLISMGGGIRHLIIGNAGVGKTSLVNYVRYEAIKNQFFTPTNEIEINRSMTCNEFIILTLSSIYSEIKRKNIMLKQDTMEKLEALYELTRYGELSQDISNLTQINTDRLIILFKEVIEDLINPRYNGIILHYDNWDNINNLKEVLELLGEIRDFLLSSKRVIFFFVGDKIFSDVVDTKTRVRQIFTTPHLTVSPLSLSETKRIFEERINKLSMDNAKAICPHTEETLKLLFELLDGNLREILNSLTNCILELPPSNTPIIITPQLAKEVLYKKVKDIYLDRLSPAEQEILFKIIDTEEFTPTKIKELTGKNMQNISSKYIPKLLDVGVIKFKKEEGRNRFYKISPQMKWLKLKTQPEEIKKKKLIEKKEMTMLIHRKLTDFI